MAVPLAWTENGFETQFSINHLGHHALSTALVPRAETGSPGPGGLRPGPKAATLPTATTAPTPSTSATRNSCGTRPSNWCKGRPHAREAVLTDGVRALARASGMSAGT